MALAFTAVSSLFIVSCGPKLLRIVVNPCAAIPKLPGYPAAVGWQNIKFMRPAPRRLFASPSF
jgi:hypothetical protein